MSREAFEDAISEACVSLREIDRPFEAEALRTTFDAMIEQLDEASELASLVEKHIPVFSLDESVDIHNLRLKAADVREAAC
jgi:hypothetical protein